MNKAQKLLHEVDSVTTRDSLGAPSITPRKSNVKVTREPGYVIMEFKVQIYHDGEWHTYYTTVSDVQSTEKATKAVALKNVLFTKRYNIKNPKILYDQLRNNPENYKVTLNKENKSYKW